MRACQALALDEERTTFHPQLWDERVVPPGTFDPDQERFIKDEQISQVWFAGVHSNVGGGYPGRYAGLYSLRLDDYRSATLRFEVQVG